MPGSQRLEAVAFDADRITALAAGGILLHVALRYAAAAPARLHLLPLYAVLLLGGLPLAVDLAVKLWRREVGADLLAGASLITSLLLGEYLVGAVIVLMLAGVSRSSGLLSAEHRLTLARSQNARRRSRTGSRRTA